MRSHLISWLWLLALVPIVMLSGCGGGGGGSGGSAPKATISGTVTFPSLNNLVGKRVALPGNLTVKVYGLDGTLKATATVAGTNYTVSGLDSGVDYVIMAIIDNKEMKALVDKGSLTTSTTRDIDTIATTALLLAEKKLGVTPGTIGITQNSSVTTAFIASLQPTVLENMVKTAVNTVLYAPGTASQTNVDLINLANVVTATVNTGVSTTQFLNDTAATPVTTIQYTLGSSGATGASTSVASADAKTTLATTASSYTPPPVDSVSYTMDVYDYTNLTGVPLKGVTVTTVGLPTTITTTTDANGIFVLAGIPKTASFYVKMSKANFADAYSSTFSLTANLNISGRPYAMYPPSKLTDWGNTSGNGVIRSRVVVNTDQATGYIGDALVTAIDTTYGVTGGVTYPVKYIDNATGAVSSTLTRTDPLNGQYVILNVPAGHTVDVTASRSGYTFTPRTFTVQANGVSQGRIVGTAAAAIDFSVAAGTYSGNFTATDGTGGTFTITVDSVGLLTGNASSGATVTGRLTWLAPYQFNFSATSSPAGSAWGGTINASTRVLNGTWYNSDGSHGTLSTGFTSAMVSGKTFTFVNNLGVGGTATLNSNGTATGSSSGQIAAASWLITTTGQLKVTHSNGSYDVITPTSITATKITGTDQYISPSYSWTGTITMTPI